MVSAASQEASGETAEHCAAPGVLRGQPPEVSVEYERAVMRAEVTAVGFGWNEEAVGYDVERHGVRRSMGEDPARVKPPCFLTPPRRRVTRRQADLPPTPPLAPPRPIPPQSREPPSQRRIDAPA